MEKYRINIETKGAEYEHGKEFNKHVELSEEEFLGLCGAIIKHIDALPARPKKIVGASGGGGGTVT